jgi:hypothetical protein
MQAIMATRKTEEGLGLRSDGVMGQKAADVCFQNSIAPLLRLFSPSKPRPCYFSTMALDATARRRWFGAIVLLAALAMLICGSTVLKEKLGYLAFIFYWMVCFALTMLAIIVAFLDARALQRRTREEQQDLFTTTLKQIETEARSRPNRRDRSSKRS